MTIALIILLALGLPLARLFLYVKQYLSREQSPPGPAAERQTDVITGWSLPDRALNWVFNYPEKLFFVSFAICLAVTVLEAS